MSNVASGVPPTPVGGNHVVVWLTACVSQPHWTRSPPHPPATGHNSAATTENVLNMSQLHSGETLLLQHEVVCSYFFLCATRRHPIDARMGAKSGEQTTRSLPGTRSCGNPTASLCAPGLGPDNASSRPMKSSPCPAHRHLTVNFIPGQSALFVGPGSECRSVGHFIMPSSTYMYRPIEFEPQ